MRIGLFIPCFIDAFAPEVGILGAIPSPRELAQHPDECCGFGGTFAEVVSAKMGYDKVSDHAVAEKHS